MEQNELLQQKLRALIETGKKEGKITSKQLLQTLDAIDADEKQTEQIYDALDIPTDARAEIRRCSDLAIEAVRDLSCDITPLRDFSEKLIGRAK